jgi:hypothetical protein
LAEIAAKLRTLVDTAHRDRIIHKVYAGSRIYAGGPLVDNGPDLVVGFEPGYRASWQTALGGAPKSLVEDNKSRWSGDHIFDPDLMPGIILSNLRFACRSFRGIDVAPTILDSLGLARSGHMSGRNLLSLDGGHQRS